MHTRRFNVLADRFAVLDLTARFAFKPETSVAFSLERYSKSLLPVRQIGWIDAHPPCDEPVRLQIRVALPGEYHDPAKLAALVKVVMAALEIPADETYEATLFAATDPMTMGQTVHRDGRTDHL